MVACSTTADNNIAPDTTPATQNGATDNQGTTNNGSVGGETAQRWRFDEFRYNEEDVLFFTPATADYMLTEVYLLEQPDSGIIYTLTILRSFDDSEKVISQIQKYSFDVPTDALYAYRVFEGDAHDYPSLVLVGYSVIAEQTADIVDTQRTKAQFISDYQEDGTKHWLSMP
jgi:hypothetical protein